MQEEPQGQQEPQDGGGQSSGDGGQSQARKRKKIEYAVYEMASATPKNGLAAQLNLIGKFKGVTKKDARWAAVDATDSLKAKAEDKGAHLLAIPVTQAEPELTKEKVREVRTRE